MRDETFGRTRRLSALEQLFRRGERRAAARRAEGSRLELREEVAEG